MDATIRREGELRDLFGHAAGLAVAKSLRRLDKHARHFISLSPFVCLASADRNGRADISPKGDPPGFVAVIDDTTLLIPDRPGNNRLDSMTNILDNPNIALIFFVPGFEDTLRVNGKASITTEPAALARLAVNGKTPKAAISVGVEEVFFHCAKALKRSRLWNPEVRQDRSALPSLGRIIVEQTSPKGAVDGEEVRAADTLVEDDYRNNMY